MNPPFRIRCDKCGTLVETMFAYTNVSKRTHTLKVVCHGENDKMTIFWETIHAVPDLQEQMMSQEGIAFLQESTR